MRLWLVLGCLSLFISHFAFANCQVEKKFDQQNHFESCKVTIEKPNYYVQAEVGGNLTEADCEQFCSQHSIVAFPHGDHAHVQIVPISLVQSWEARLSELGLQLAPEVLISNMFASMIALYENLDQHGDIVNQLWDQYVQSQVHQRNESQVINSNEYTTILKSQLPSLDLDCTICGSKLAGQMDSGKEVVQLNKCKHHFCKECITEWSHYNSECPLCRQKLDTVNSSESQSND